MRVFYYMSMVLVGCLFLSCNSCSKENSDTVETLPEQEPDFYLGADLSYVNEMEACGAVYKNAANEPQDVYTTFKQAGANLVRVRLWHNPTWTSYSNFNDVKNTIARAKAQQLRVLLDFHYSDTWADPQAQEVPQAWVAVVNNTQVLGDSLYQYTYKTLVKLHDANLVPDIVQLGNEINGMLLQQGELQWPIDWDRNSYLINKAIAAVHDFNSATANNVATMLHIAAPENALWWFEQATANGVTAYDWIGISYYPLWSEYTLANVGQVFQTLINTYQKRLMVVETAYPYTLENADNFTNILGQEALLNGYPATETGQLNYLNALRQVIANAGGEGLIYWEPAWVTTSCNTLWGQGSAWDNATLFNHSLQPTMGMQFYNAANN